MVEDIAKMRKELKKLKEKKKKKSKILSKKILAKPKAKIQKKDILKSLKRPTDYRMVTEERLEEREYNRSPYFTEAFRKEKERESKWLS